MKHTIFTVIISVVATLIITFALINPMGRSEAAAILSQQGACHFDSDGTTVYLQDGPSVLELQALAVVAEATEGVNLIILK